MKKNKLIPLLVALGLSGCASTPDNNVATIQSELDQVQQENSRLTQLNQELESSNTVIRNSNATSAGDDLLPPNAKPGECYARILIPETYEMTSSRMLKSAATERVEIIPATYKMVDKSVLVSEASKTTHAVPAQYEMVDERVGRSRYRGEKQRIP